MEIIAGSEQGGISFIHTGYTSAHPRKVRRESLTGNLSLEAEDSIDVGEALELKEVQASAPIKPVPGRVSISLPIFGILAFFSLLAIIHLVRRRKQIAGACLIGLSLLALLLISFSGRSSGRDRYSGKDPGLTGMAPQTYKNPEQATRVLMHGILAESIAHRNAMDWGRAAQAATLPIKRPTSSMQAALRNCRFDGWGTAFLLEESERRMVIRCAGPDKAYHTSDDITLDAAPIRTSWDHRPRPVFLTSWEDKTVLVFRTPEDHRFRYSNKHLASRIADSSEYDAMYASADLLNIYKKKADGNKTALVMVLPRRPSSSGW